MADIFISYSRKDSDHALSLAEKLRADGIQVWIDQHGIIGAEKWATEIVEGIKGCSTFILLISPDSVASENVLRELSLANESRKRILPVEIQRIELPSSFMYPLAGLQRVKIADFEGIIRAHKHGVARVAQADIRKTLMILPFEDISPGGDNEWFTNGIVSELISSLSNVKALKLCDAQATKEFKSYKGQLSVYAREMDIRYFVQGDVRKFGDQIKISARLLDIETGDHLWQESMKGTMENIFDFQEEVALKVVEGLKVHLASGEKKKLAERGTENAEAYELFMRGEEYFLHQTKEGYEIAVQLFTEAIRIDPHYADAFQSKANALVSLYGRYVSDPTLLDEAERLCKEALRLKPDHIWTYLPLSRIYTKRGMLAEAEELALECIRKHPLHLVGNDMLAQFYLETGQPAKGIAPLEQAVRLSPDYRPSLWNLVHACDSAGEHEKCAHWAALAVPIYERYLKLHPDDETTAITLAHLLVFSGRTDEAHAAAVKLKDMKDGVSLFNTACLFGSLGDKSEALRTFRKAIEAGLRSISHLKGFLSDEKEGIVSLAGTPEYEEVKRIVEKIEAEQGVKING